VLPLLVFAATLVYLLTQEGGNTTRRTLIEANESLARVVQSELSRSAEDLERLSLAAAADPDDPELALRLASSLAGPGQPFSAIILVTEREERVLGGNAGIAVDPSVRQRGGQRGISNFQKTVGWGRGVVEVSTPYQAQAGTTLVGQLNLQRLARTLASHSGERSYATVLDANDIILARSTDFEMYVGEPPSRQTLEAIHGNSRGTARFPTRDGRELFWSWRRLPGSDWVVFLGTQAREMDASFRDSLRQLLLGAALALALGLLAAGWTGRRIVRAVEDLTEQTPGLVSGTSRTYRPSGLKQVDELYDALAAAGARLQLAQDERDNALLAEQALRRSAERESRTKDVFIATLSHELRNPLAPIVAAARLLQREGLAPVHVARAAAIIDRQSRMLSHLLDDLLDASRLTTGRVHLNRKPTPLADVFQAASEAVRPLMQERQHRLLMTLQPEGLAVLGDKVRLVQVTVNLLNNAAKYTDPGGRIELAAVPHGDREILLTVTDNGIGISEEAIPHIFNIFGQVESERERAQGGLGIGLFLVKGLVQLHGGQVRASSPGPGKGTRFEVTLPRTVAPAALPSADLAASGFGREERKAVLVVDDNVDAAMTLKALLEISGGFEVDVVHTGEDALLRADETGYDAICVDIGLPGIDGYEVAKRLKSRTEAKLVATTGWGTFEDKRRAFDAGFDSHLTKPVDPDELMRELLVG
jgi:signal transduction histidine kinase